MRFDIQNKRKQLGILVLGCLLSFSAHCKEDDFLSAIEAESNKLDSRENVAEEPPKKNAGNADKNKRDEFEKKLEDSYHGSYVFYSKLPERVRQEIVQEYSRGTPFMKIRKKIVNRYLQR